MTQPLTDRKSSEHILECFRELLLTLNQICTKTNEFKDRVYQTMVR